MAFDTYTTLQDAINGWIGNTLFTARVPDMITLFESTANRRLRVRQQETQAGLTPSGTTGGVALPTDYLAWRHVTWLGSPIGELQYVPANYFSVPETSDVGTPALFTIEGEAIKVRPISSTTIRLDYFQKIPSLSVSAPTNWLLLAHPDVYLFGAMCEAELLGMNDERFPLWKARRDECFDEIEKLSNKTRGVGGMRVLGPTP